MLFALLFLVTCFPTIFTKFYNDTFTDFSSCKVHYSWFESEYTDFFELGNLSGNNSDDLVVDLHFSVMAESDAHILLSPTYKPKITDSVYEIVLGAGGNTFSDIRRKQKGDVRASFLLNDTLSALDVRSFWIHISKEGLIEVGKEEKGELPFITWKDPEPLAVKLFSFCTWPGLNGKWYFDCPRKDEDNKKKYKKVLKGLEKLRNDFLTSYDPHVRPVYNYQTKSLITISLETNFIALNSHESTMNIRGKAKLVWQDEKIRWNPDNYDNISNIHIIEQEIWEPRLTMFYNAKSTGGTRILEKSIKVVQHDGVVEWKPNFDITTWCDMTELVTWPKDNHTCSVTFGFWEDAENFQLEFNSLESKLNNNFNKEWKVIEVDFILGSGIDDDFNPPFLEIIYSLKRESSLYNDILSSTYIVIVISMLLSFWMTSVGYRRMYLCSFQLILHMILIIALIELLPGQSNKIPVLVFSYVISLIANSLCFAVAAVNANIIEWNYIPPYNLKRFLSSKIIQVILLLPSDDSYDEDIYETEVISVGKQSIKKVWEKLAALIDRLMFIIYIVLFCILYYINIKF